MVHGNLNEHFPGHWIGKGDLKPWSLQPLYLILVHLPIGLWETNDVLSENWWHGPSEGKHQRWSWDSSVLNSDKFSQFSFYSSYLFMFLAPVVKNHIIPLQTIVLCSGLCSVKCDNIRPTSAIIHINYGIMSRELFSDYNMSLIWHIVNR
jgi:hypothetical protein